MNRSVSSHESSCEKSSYELYRSKFVCLHPKVGSKQAYNLATIAQCRIELDSARFMVLNAAARIDREGAKKSRKEIAMIKAMVPKLVCDVLDRSLQIHGGAGVSQDTFLAYGYALCRTLRLADGPDEVHLMTVGKIELKDHEDRSRL